MNKKIFLFGVCLLFIQLLWAQETEKGIRFIDNEPWEKVLKKAKKQHKPIFVDCYTSWCGPCKQLAKDVFTREDVGQFVNEQFVSVKYDVEKENGLNFARQYRDQISAFPTLLLIQTDGTVMSRIVGAYPAEEILQSIKDGLEGKTWQKMAQEYEAGKRDYNFIIDYLNRLSIAGEDKKYEEVRHSYVKSFPVDSLLNRQIWDLGKDYIRNPKTEEYQFLLHHLNEFANRGFNRYDLEWTLAILSFYPISDIVKESLKDRNSAKKETWMKELKELEKMLEKPIKKFPEYLAYTRLEQSYLEGDTEELAYRLIYLGENHLLDMLDWEKAWIEYVIDHLSDKQLLRRCVDYLQGKQTANEEGNDWIINNCYGVLAKGYTKLGEQAKAEACSRRAVEVDKQNKEKLNF